MRNGCSESRRGERKTTPLPTTATATTPMTIAPVAYGIIRNPVGAGGGVDVDGPITFKMRPSEWLTM
jgi:hypothetical protein